MAKTIVCDPLVMTSDEFIASMQDQSPLIASSAGEFWLIANRVIPGDMVVLEEGQTNEEYWQEVDRKRKAIDAERRKART